MKWIALAIFIAAACLRIAVNDVTQFSPADETIYTELSARLAGRGFVSEYPAIAREWIADSDWWRYPSPLRCGHFALTTLAMRIRGEADPRALAWLSTLAGIAVLPLLLAIAKRLANMRTALLAAAFVAVSPLELALGRRALQDEVVCAATLLAFAAIVKAVDERTKTSLLLAIAALTFALTVKETVFFLVPAFALFVFFVTRKLDARDAAMLLAPALLWYAILAALTRDVTMPFRTARLVVLEMAAPYVVQYQSGPPHRLLFDFFLLAPLVFVLASAAAVTLFVDAARDPRMRAVAVFVLAAFAVFSLVASKNVRFVVMLDPLVCLLAAWMITPHRDAASLTAIAAANAAIGLELFYTTFIRGAVYDPVTHTLLTALGAVPRDSTTAPAPMHWPWLCAAIAAAAALTALPKRRLAPSHS